MGVSWARTTVTLTSDTIKRMLVRVQFGSTFLCHACCHYSAMSVRRYNNGPKNPQKEMQLFVFNS
jgi:hypothetical protein